MQACQQLLYCGTLVILERLLSVYGDDSVSKETLPTVLEVVGHLWPLLPLIAIWSCSTYVTIVWLQLQPEDRVVFIHRLSEIGWDQTFNLFVRTDRTSVKFSPDVIERQGRIGAAVTCTSDWDLILFSDGCRFNLSHADGPERVYRRREKHFADAWLVER